MSSLIKKSFDEANAALQKKTGLQKKKVFHAESSESGIKLSFCQRIDLQQKDYLFYANEILKNVASFNLLSLDSLEEIRCMYFAFLNSIKKIRQETEGQKFVTYFQIYDMTIKLCMNAKMQFKTDIDNRLCVDGLKAIFGDVFERLNKTVTSDKNVLLKITYVAVAAAVLESELKEGKDMVRHFLQKPTNYFMQAVAFLYYEGTFLKDKEGKSPDIFYGQNDGKILLLNFNGIAETIQGEIQLFNDIFLYWRIIENKRNDKMEENAQRLVNDLENWGNIGFVPRSNVLYLLRRGSGV